MKNRAQRRADTSYSRSLARGVWAPLEPKHLTLGERALFEGLGNFVAAFLNNVVSVQVYERSAAFGTLIHLAVRRHDMTEIAGFDLLQRVKNEVAGSEAFAVEVYPRASELVDDAPMRHLFVLPGQFGSDLSDDLTILWKWI